MNPFALPATLVLPGDVGFVAIDACLRDLGFRNHGPGLPTVDPDGGEVAEACWSWGGTLPMIDYAFHAAPRLRLLDVATVPPEMRAEIAISLGAIAAVDVRDALRDPDPRRVLWATWAIGATEDLSALPLLIGIGSTSEGLLQTEIGKVAERLTSLADARMRVAAAEALIAERAFELFDMLRDVEMLKTLKPTAEDCAKIVDGSIADALWPLLSARPDPDHGIDGAPTDPSAIAAISAGGLRWPNQQSARFPRGMRHIAGWLRPERVWLSWRGADPSGGERLMDGLVFVEDHWVWVPKVWRDMEYVILPYNQPVGSTSVSP